MIRYDTKETFSSFILIQNFYFYFYLNWDCEAELMLKTPLSLSLALGLSERIDHLDPQCMLSKCAVLSLL